MKTVNYEQGEKVTLACILGNIALSVLKLAAGIFGGSKAMIADGLHSVSDIIATTVVYIGIKIANKPVDENHHYGHGKIEPIASAFVGICLFFAGILIVKEITESIIDHSFTTPTVFALLAAIISILVKETMYRVTYSVGKKINSQSIMADAWHHRSDALSSIATMIGIGGAIIGSVTGMKFLEYLDPIAGAVVACLIFKVAYDILKYSLNGLMDASPESVKIDLIKEIVSELRDVVSISSIKGRYVGQYLYIDLAIEVNGSYTVEQGHGIADKARSKILDRIEDAFEVLIHVDPVNI